MIRLLLTAGRGPAECRIALGKTLQALTQEAEAQGLAIDCAPGDARDRHGPASAVVVIDGDGAQAFALGWIGSVLWVTQSPLRAHHKRKNWFVGIHGLPAGPACAARIDAACVRFESFRAGGAGGQHQNKTESAVRAVHIPTGLVVVARDERSQHRNKAAAKERLAALVDLQGALVRLADQQAVQANHDRLERGRPIRRFRGEGFEPY